MIFLPEFATGLRLKSRGQLGQEPPGTVRGPEGELRYQPLDDRGLKYEVFVPPTPPAGSPPRSPSFRKLPASERPRYLTLPPGLPPRIGALAEEWTRGRVDRRRQGARHRGAPAQRVPLRSRVALGPIQAAPRRLPLRVEARPLRVLLHRHGGDAAHGGRPDAQRHRLHRGQLQPLRQVLRRPAGRRPLLGRGLPRRRRLEDLRSHAPRRRRPQERARRRVGLPARFPGGDQPALGAARGRLRSEPAGEPLPDPDQPPRRLAPRAQVAAPRVRRARRGRGHERRRRRPLLRPPPPAPTALRRRSQGASCARRARSSRRSSTSGSTRP